ncbi:MAG: hypothetical protein H6R14_134 [Proteobacteria bacterium]|nr:hypothetical protein [Pseudomonadota bacterium]
MSDSNLNDERRKREERRRINAGPPAGMCERRVNIERRLFNLGIDSGKGWMGVSAQEGASLAAAEITELNANYELKRRS